MTNKEFIYNAIMDKYDSIYRFNIIEQNAVCIKSVNSPFKAGEQYDLSNFSIEEHFRNLVYPDDYAAVLTAYNFDHITDLCERREEGPLCIYRILRDGHYIWNEDYILIPRSYGPADPEVMFCSRIITSGEAMQMDMQVHINNRMVKMIRLNIKTGMVDYLYTGSDAEYLTSEFKAMSFDEKVIHIIDIAVYKEDMDVVSHFYNLEYLRDHFACSVEPIYFFYRRKASGSFKWVKCIISRAYNYSEDNPAVICMFEKANTEAQLYLAEKMHDDYKNKFFKNRNAAEDNFWADTLAVLTTFAMQYVAMMLIDLEKDTYISFRSDVEYVNTNIDSAGSYSGFYKDFLHANYSDDDIAKLGAIFSIENLREQMRTKLSYEFTYTDFKDRPIHISYVRMQTSGMGTTKVLCTAVSSNADNSKLKVKTFGNFTVTGCDGAPVRFEKKQSKQVFAYLIDRHGYPVSIRDIVEDILEKPSSDLNAQKYASALINKARRDLEAAGYKDVIVSENHVFRVNTDAVDCDYYHLIDGDSRYFSEYHNEYMKEYSWAEETNAEIMEM